MAFIVAGEECVCVLRNGVKVKFSADTILTLKNGELIHFGFLMGGFGEKELIHEHELIYELIQSSFFCPL